MLQRLDDEHRPATPDEQTTLARWAGWGALPQLFDERDEGWAERRKRVRALLGGGEAEWAQARRTTLNAHYTSAEVVEAMWGAVGELGFTTGDVLEPGCGSGNFIGLAPPGARLTGIELDATTAAVARHLYGNRATIHTGRFEELDAPDGCFDLVIGNVPFAKVTPFDRRHNQGRHALHNYFLVKSLHLTRPGGLVAALTSRYTLDARNPAARAEMAELADLVGAVRLPAGAFRQSSGTDVVTDLVILRRREEGREPGGLAWLRTETFAEAREMGEPPALNEVFVAHPELVAGRLGVTRGMYRDGELTVEGTGRLAEDLRACLAVVVDDARQHGRTLSPRLEATPPRSPAAAPRPAGAQEGALVVNPDLSLARVVGGRLESYSPRVGKDAAELRRLIALRDAAQATLAVQLSNGSDAELGAAQAELGERYANYRRLYGPLNRSTTVRTGRVDAATGQDRLRQQRPRMGGFRDDPGWPLVAALEVFDEETQTAAPAAIFTQRVVDPRPPPRGVDTPAEAVAVCLDESGEVTTARAAELLGMAEEEAGEALRSLVWEDPATAALVPAAQYLSGDVRIKLEAAQAAAVGDGRWQANVDALAAVLPRQLAPTEISAQLGAPWIPPSDIEAFGSEVLGVGLEVERLASLGQWTVVLRSGSRASVSLTSQWGTARADGVTLLGASLNQRLHTVTDEIEPGRRVRNDAETIAAREKQDALGARFSGWVWDEPARAERLAERYNRLFSSTVVPSYDGTHLSLPGLSASFSPHAHQRDAVARLLTEGRALLAHAVGAGKTATMVMAAMEMRRLGLVCKPAVVVPNHMLEQFSREWLQLYPTAKVLLADRDRLSSRHRKEFVGRCALGDWDAVVFSHSGFARLPLGAELQNEYLADELARSREALAESRSGKALSVKRLERRIAQLEEKYQALMAADAKDDGICFEETGVDYLFVDFTTRAWSVCHVRSRSHSAVWDTPPRSLCTPHWRGERMFGRGPLERPPCATRRAPRRAAVVGRPGHGHGRRARPG
ncbi:MAG: methyltransferase domain-containing protein [Actinobacteria bacterium]|nr:methyltransferase domain-containing protein [Actinomycetota bacterium]